MKELFMKEALIRAKIAFEKDEVPIGKTMKLLDMVKIEQ